MESPGEETKPCPFCGETIRAVAIKCRFCNEMLTGMAPGDQVVSVRAETKVPQPSDEKPQTMADSAAIRWLLGLVVVAGIVVLVVQANSGSSAGTEFSSRSTSSASEHTFLAPSPQVIVDEELAVDASGWQSRGFSLPSSHPIQVSAEGLKHGDKGFTVYVMESDQLDNFKNGATFQHVPALQGLKVRKYNETATLPAGSWTVVVQNSENIAFTMVVHLRVVADPG